MLDRVPAPLVTANVGERGAALGAAGHTAVDRHLIAESADGRWQVAGIGRLHDCRRLLGVRQGDDSFSVAGVILELVSSGRLDALKDANGLFCAAIVDRREHRLSLVTDRFAGFPIHVWHGPDRLVFAGQIHVLLGAGGIPRKADPHGLAQLFTLQRTIGRTTSVADVWSIPAATVLEFDGRKIVERRYEDLTWGQPDFGEKEGAGRLAGALRAAVEREVGPDGGALLLSGGIDSRLLLAAARPGSLSCWTTASYAENPELAIAVELAQRYGAEHHALIVDPADTLDVIEQTTIESNGLYPASTPMSAFLPVVGAAASTILTGHGLDYTLRGYYLPAQFVELAGSRTRLPRLRSIPARPTGSDVLRNLRQGPPLKTIDRIVAKGRRDTWWCGLEEALDRTLQPWLDSDDPYNAWDAFILHALSKHYAFTSMMSVRAVGYLGMPAFDREVFEIYLKMPPAWRCSGRMVKDALRLLAGDAARIPNANTHFRADLHPWIEITALFGRAALRKTGILQRPWKPTQMHAIGSWQDIGELYRHDARHRQRFLEIRDRLDALAFGVLSEDGLSACIEEHLNGNETHTKLLRQLLTHDAWVREFGIA
jgi:asparagine synthetase B (glutamine-hydrolysing)